MWYKSRSFHRHGGNTLLLRWQISHIAYQSTLRTAWYVGLGLQEGMDRETGWRSNSLTTCLARSTTCTAVNSVNGNGGVRKTRSSDLGWHNRISLLSESDHSYWNQRTVLRTNSTDIAIQATSQEGVHLENWWFSAQTNNLGLKHWSTSTVWNPITGDGCEWGQSGRSWWEVGADHFVQSDLTSFRGKDGTLTNPNEHCCVLIYGCRLQQPVSRMNRVESDGLRFGLTPGRKRHLRVQLWSLD